MKKYILWLSVLLCSSFALACTDEDIYMGEPIPEAQSYTLTASASEFTFDTPLAGEQQFSISTTSNSWRILRADDNEGWCTCSATFGVAGTFNLKISVTENEDAARSTVMTLSAYGCEPIEITVSQAAVVVLPDNIASDQTDMRALSSTQLISDMGIGWNLGNSLEVPTGETGWGNPATTKAMIDMVKAAGFKTVRIPTSWAAYFKNGTTTIKPTWIARVKEVVDYCIDNGMYVVLNEHWDNGWLNNATVETQTAQAEKLAAIWKQVAKEFRDYDDHLIFAGMNEVTADTPTEESYAALNLFAQTFITTVRATGGRNTYRHLAVQLFNTDITAEGVIEKFVVPTDPTADRMMIEFHYYTPYQFCLMEEAASWGAPILLWGKFYTGSDAYNKESQLDSYFQRIADFSTRTGIPAILGEYGAILHLDLATEAGNLAAHKESRAYYAWYVNKVCKEKNICPIYWDNGGITGGVVGNNGMGIFDRKGLKIADTGLCNGIIDGYAGTEFSYHE